MARPKSNTPEGRLATERWRLTMQEKHGDITKFMQEVGSIGGKAGNTGGFASGKLCDCDLIKGSHVYQRCAGKKGGQRSKRTKPYAKRTVTPEIGIAPTPRNGFEPTKKKKLWIF